jgi:hypothetical protein
MSTSVAATPPVASQGISTAKWIWLGVAILVGLAIAFSSTPQGRSRIGQLVLATHRRTVVSGPPGDEQRVASVLMMAPDDRRESSRRHGP